MIYHSIIVKQVELLQNKFDRLKLSLVIDIEHFIFVESDSLIYDQYHHLVLLLSEWTSSGGLAENSRASWAHNNFLGVTEDCGDLVTSWKFHVHEVGVWWLDQLFYLCLRCSSSKDGFNKSIFNGMI